MAEARTPLLPRVEPTLPTRFYLDPDHYRRELEAFWYRHWLCVGRDEDLPRPRDYRLYRVGDQSILVARDLGGRLRAFHNTCRHRGSALCAEASGRLAGASIVCPYHGWTYSLEGALLGAPHQILSPDFRKQDYPLYPVAVEAWAGFVFVNLLGDGAPPLSGALGTIPDELAHWPLSELRIGHRVVREIRCNWKVFWENFSECFHCPGVHPELSRLVPAYGRGLLDAADDPRGAAAPGLAPGAVTWTLDGASRLPAFGGLDAEERRRGQTFGVLPPSAFVVAHVDYVRLCRMLPRGPEAIELAMDWLFSGSVLASDGFDRDHAVALGERVMQQDALACERNQQGLHCARHARGVLVPQEYGVLDFHRWVRQGLRHRGGDGGGSGA
jgi:Rieske 2Fe-2S family protein